MTEEQLVVFLGVDEVAREQMLRLLNLGARLHLEEETEEIVVTAPSGGVPVGAALEWGRVPFRPETVAAERRYAARLLLGNANRVLQECQSLLGVVRA